MLAGGHPGDALFPIEIPRSSPQARKLREGAVVGHQHCVNAQGVCADQEAHRREHPALAVGGGSGGSVDLCGGYVPGQDIYPSEELPNRGVARRGVGPLGQTEQQFALGDARLRGAAQRGIVRGRHWSLDMDFASRPPRSKDESAKRRRAQEEFVANGLRSREDARRTGKYYRAETVHDELHRRLDARRKALFG